jgi:hypothetical protein
VLHAAGKLLVAPLGVVCNLAGDGLLAASVQRDLMARVHKLARQVHANEASATCAAVAESAGDRQQESV